jgi:hypothetical protein
MRSKHKGCGVVPADRQAIFEDSGSDLAGPHCSWTACGSMAHTESDTASNGFPGFTENSGIMP